MKYKQVIATPLWLYIRDRYNKPKKERAFITVPYIVEKLSKFPQWNDAKTLSSICLHTGGVYGAKVVIFLKVRSCIAVFLSKKIKSGFSRYRTNAGTFSWPFLFPCKDNSENKISKNFPLKIFAFF